MASLEKWIWVNTALSSLDMMPPRPAVIAHGKVLPVVQEHRIWNVTAQPRHSARLYFTVRWLCSCACRIVSGPSLTCALEASEARKPRLETFRQRTTVPTLLWVLNRQSLGKASPTCTPPPICTLAPFPKPRWSQERRHRERLKEYTMRKDSQRI
jgi:hypothetical protein